MVDVPYRWAALELLLNQEGELAIIFRRDDGWPRGPGPVQRRERYDIGSIFDWLSNPSAPSIDAATHLLSLIEAALRAGPEHLPNRNRITFPVFFAPPGMLPRAPWEILLRRWLTATKSPAALVLRARFIRLPKWKWVPHKPFRLPLVIHAADKTASEALGTFRNDHWYRENTEVQKTGIQIDYTPLPKHPNNAKIVIGTGDRRKLKRITKAFVKERPRLVVLLDDPESPGLLRQDLPPPGMAVLHLCAHEGRGEAVRELVFGIIHDLSLHEIVDEIEAKVVFPRRESSRIELYADPETNQGLRMTDALAEMLREASALTATSPLGDVDGFLTRLRARSRRPAVEAVLTTSRGQLVRAARPQEQVFAELRRTQEVRADFRYEAAGILPLVRAEATLKEAKQAALEVATALEEIISDPEIFELARRTIARNVDARVERLDDVTGKPVPAEDGRPFLSSDTTLHVGARYNLLVTIGRSSPESLIEGMELPADPLLSGRKDGYEVEITFYPLDFKAELQARRVDLPHLGASETVIYPFSVPPKRLPDGDSHAPLRLRFTIHHGNHLVQSFVLEALVDSDENDHRERALRIRREFLRSKQFSNVDQLPRRLMSLATNQDPSAKTHTLMLKQGEVVGSVQFTEAVMSSSVQNIREILGKAMLEKDGRGRLFSADFGSSPARRGYFEETLRQLAAAGSELSYALFRKLRGNSRLRKELQQVREADDSVIQVVRFDDGYAFPWSSIYDYDMPKSVAGAPPPGVCPGYETEGGALKRCTHGPDDTEVICARGFWGVRHVVEELLSSGATGDAVNVVARPRHEGAVLLSIGSSQSHATQLPTELQRNLPANTVVGVVPPDELLDVLWDDARRPAQVVVLGHLTSSTVDGQPIGLRIQSSNERWLLRTEIDKRFRRLDCWNEPRPIVLLMACNSGATEVATLNDFLLSFSTVGATAIVGTECQVATSLVARFTREVTRDLWDHKELGHAVASFRRRLLVEYNPLGFAFTAFGGADVTIACPQSETSS